ncbi:hypothetical protein F5887DRAFT_1075114 [Amanita rubescens]|nr:hypothetical protein F5887DRAFT_1075114 [Amanita rubescens]
MSNNTQDPSTVDQPMHTPTPSPPVSPYQPPQSSPPPYEVNARLEREEWERNKTSKEREFSPQAQPETEREASSPSKTLDPRSLENNANAVGEPANDQDMDDNLPSAAPPPPTSQPTIQTLPDLPPTNPNAAPAEANEPAGENEEPEGEDELQDDPDAEDDSQVLPTMDYHDFVKRYNGRDYHLTRAATLQSDSVKCHACKKGRVIPFCVLDIQSPKTKCLRCKRNRIAPCDNTDHAYDEEVTTFPPMKKLHSAETIEEEVDDDDEARSILSERRSSRMPKPSAKKTKRMEEDDDDDDVKPKHSFTIKTRSKASKSKSKPPRSTSPDPQLPKIDIPTLNFEKLRTYSREQRMGKYAAYTEAVISRVEADLDNTRNRIEAQVGEMRRNLQEVARLEYRRGKQDERDAADARAAEERARSRRDKSSRKSVDTVDQDIEDDEDAEEYEEDEEDNPQPPKKKSRRN